MDQALHREVVCQRQDRLLTTLERLLELPTTDVNSTLNQAAQLVAEVLAAEKVDAFLHNSLTDTLVAIGTNDTPMGKRQQAVGMDRLLLGNGGRLVEVFLTGVPYLTGHADLDSEELVGVKVGMGVKSEIATVFEVEAQQWCFRLIPIASGRSWKTCWPMRSHTRRGTCSSASYWTR